MSILILLGIIITNAPNVYNYNSYIHYIPEKYIEEYMTNETYIVLLNEEKCKIAGTRYKLAESENIYLYEADVYMTPQCLESEFKDVGPNNVEDTLRTYQLIERNRIGL